MFVNKQKRKPRTNTLVSVTLTAACSILPISGFAYYDDPDALLNEGDRGGSAVWDYCYGKPDAEPLPPDPRTLIQPGVSDGRAVHFNTFWKDCHTDPVAIKEEGSATTCGELREKFNRGAALLTGGSEGVGALFASDNPMTLTAAYGISTLTQWQYNHMWRSWGGYWKRPDNYDQLVAERYGSGLDYSQRNPYPLPGEDPNKTNGGSGQLPVLFTQLRDKNGDWSGRIGVTCHGCHSGEVGSPEDGKGLGLTYGSGSSLADLDLLLRDTLPLGYPASLATFANLSRTRGTNNASDINLAFMFPDDQLLPPLGDLIGGVFSGSTGSMDTPAWWNMGHKPSKFVDAVFPMDAPRVDMVFYTPFFGLFGTVLGPISEDGQDWMRDHGPAANTWVETLKSPKYPYPVDETLAEEGSELFHTLDLWGSDRDNPIERRPEGNGSCAGCHGAYAPKYVNDPDFLASPDLEGMAGYVVPLDIIGTDTNRATTNNQAVQRNGARNFFGYPNSPEYCGPQNLDEVRGDREIGYIAPPLYGVWASAPYMHNGSIPNVWEILKPEDRPSLWRRVSKPKIKNPWWNNGNVVMGYDTDLDRAYDQDKMGWKYDKIACERRTWWNPSVTPYINCDPGDEDATPAAQNIMKYLYSNFIVVWNLLAWPTITVNQIEDRKIYNTHMYTQGNEGHEFNSVLTDHERLAIIEYLKTL